jgi:FG-GAP repeat
MRPKCKFITRCLLLLALATLTACGGGDDGGGGTPPVASAGGPSAGGDGGGNADNPDDCGDGAPTESGPLMSAQQAYVKASNARALDGFGGALALSANGNLLVVGARGDWNGANGFAAIHGGAPSTGAAYVFTRSGTTWTQRAQLQPSNLNLGDGFGVAAAVSADGKTIAIGAYGDSGVASASGAVYVFVCSAGAWSQEAFLKASNAGGGDQFGAIVSLSADGDTLAVGAPGEDSPATGIGGDQAANNANNSGAVYVFTRSAAAWTQQAYVKASNTGAADAFGSAVRLSGDGDTLAVGAFNENSAATGINGDQADNSALDAGAVYVFARSGGTWSQQAYVKASNTDAEDNFGLHLALSGDGNTLAVGARGEASSFSGIGAIETDNSARFAGAVYVFIRSQASWAQQAYLKASNAQINDRFGRSVALSADGNVLFVGAVDEASTATGIDGNQASNSASLSGAAYEFVRSGASWAQVRYIKASNTATRDFFGWSIALSSDASTLAVGAPDEDSAATGIDGDQADNSAVSAGAVYVFR